MKFVSDRPFAKYEMARFRGGFYETDDPVKIAILKQSAFYGKAFKSFDDLMEKSTVDKMSDEDIVAYVEGLPWGNLKQVASERGIKIYRKSKMDLIRELIAAMQSENLES